ncbi:hypothetical protein GAW91_000175 [Vibrio fluvialis]|nr:hypothetical protein [Vibrio fluvialis]
MTYIVERNGNDLPFNPKLIANGKEVKIVAASIHHENNVSRRLAHLLGKILWDHDECIDAEYLNKIGFSHEDASQLSMQIDGLENINPPHGWENE